ncbi:thioredoxin family protein [Butyricimonas hominis]|uniref:Thioredoxin family protein n=1 Tax=Butyricimonas hominis TaxID=2763032 RepID=A0ABR7CX26_9BACT|nr:thioredoxin family protein [Butyricimonas hominis]MBC5620218.1 thioredoxin family protein [Butyricimonas hominis]
MKKIYLFIAILFVQITVFAQEGVNFRDLTFTEALEAAKKENKLVFMDCYTEWCGPCKNMANNVFPRKEAGDYFNPRFVCVKYDMEKGEGVELAKKFDVHAYPTFVIIRPDGTIQHKLVGGDKLETFIDRVEKGLNEKTSLLYMHQEYEKGKMSNAELLAYKNALSDAASDEKAAKVYKELLQRLTDKEKTEKEYWSIYEDESCVIGSPMFDFLLANLDAIRKNTGEEIVEKFLFYHHAKILQDYIAGYAKEDAAPVEKVKAQINGFRIKGQESLEKMLALAEPVSQRDIEKVAAIVKAKIPHVNAEELKMYAFGFRTILWKTQEPYPANYGKLGKKLTQQVIAHMEKKAENLSSNDLTTYDIILSCFGDRLEKEDYARLIALGEKVLPGLPDDENKRHSEWIFDGYKKRLNKEKQPDKK